LITIGRLVPQKDISTILRALSILVTKGIAFQMTILGEGPLELELKNLSRNLGISKRISWLGKTTNVFHYLRESDIFILSSTYEGFGLVILEAMDAQVPIVCSAIPTLKEILGSNYRGLFEVGNSDSLVKTLLYSIENAPKLLIDMKSKEEKFDSRKMAVEISAIYSKAFLS
jgi:glycosyltransferase involved in cell wall biosynthesis